MGLFSSSKSSSTTQNFTDQFSANFGDLAHNNIAVGGDYNPVGLSDDNLYAILDFVSGTYKTTVSNIQTNAEKAIDASADSYQKANSTTTTFFDAVTPALAIAAVAVVALLILRSR